VSGERLRRILGLALPIMAGMVSQNVFNLVDTAMVGTLGNTALAAVGLGGFTAFTCQALIMGVSTGVQATSARRKGEGREAEMAHPLNAGLLLSLIVGLLLTALLVPLLPRVFPLLTHDPAVAASGSAYVELRILATTFIAMNFSFRGYFNAVDRPRLYMATLMSMHAMNIVLNYALIFGNLGAPALGVRGAGLATALAQAFGTGIYMMLGWRHARANGFLAGLPTVAEIRALARLSLPAGVQQLFFAAGYTVLYWIIGQVGTGELAAANVLINLMLVAYLPAMGFGLSAASLVGQALGRKNPDDALRWGWDVVKVAIGTLVVLSLPMWTMPGLLLGAFIHDPATLALAQWPMRVAGALIPIEGVSMVLMMALQGAGATRTTMTVSVLTQWLIFLPLAYLIGPGLGFGLLAIWLVQGGYRFLSAFIYAGLWARGRWSVIKV